MRLANHGFRPRCDGVWIFVQEDVGNSRRCHNLGQDRLEKVQVAGPGPTQNWKIMKWPYSRFHYLFPRDSPSLLTPRPPCLFQFDSDDLFLYHHMGRGDLAASRVHVPYIYICVASCCVQHDISALMITWCSLNLCGDSPCTFFTHLVKKSSRIQL